MVLEQTQNRPVRSITPKPAGRGRGLLACGAASALWGTGFFFGKLAMREMSVSHMVFYRFFFASVALLPLLLLHRPVFTLAEWISLTLTALFGVPLQFLIQFHGLALTSLSHAALMVGTMPAIMAVGAAVFLHERLRIRGWLAILGSTLGACLIASGGTSQGSGAEHSSLRGDALIVFSLMLSLVWVLSSLRLTRLHSPLLIGAWTIVLGTVMTAAWTFPRAGLPPIHNISRTAWFALVASGLLCTAATTLLWNWGLTKAPASEAGVMLNMEPIVGSTLGMVLFGDRLGLSGWVGGAMILTCATLVSLQPATAKLPLPGLPE